ARPSGGPGHVARPARRVAATARRLAGAGHLRGDRWSGGTGAGRELAAGRTARTAV
ncbi:MAG: hypothetical protein AVDCRST_MAG29-844, partial [uncultured Nocardioidaceae bacterium]